MGIKDSSLWAREILSFLETAKNGSINGTAEANAMKQSNLSRTLKSLEEKLKCQLLERGYNGVRLTENGREVFKVACDLDKVIYKVKNFTISDKNVSGKIRLWTSDGLGTAGAVIINMVFFGESRKMSRIVGVGLIVIGVVGLKMVS